jgi:hypothetical protein
VALIRDVLRVILLKAIWAPEKGFKTMQTQAAMIEDNSNALKDIPSEGGIGNWMTRLFGCWHKEMSRPFASQGQTYRTCLNCGASRRFNVGRWEMQGDFFYRRPAWQ